MVKEWDYNMVDYKNILYASIAIVSSLLLVFLIGLLNIYNSFLNTLSIVDYVSFNSEKIDTINTVAGERKICSYDSYIEEGHERYEIGYCGSLTSDDTLKYGVYLLGEGFIKVKDDKNREWYVRESVDDNKLLGVYIDPVESIIIYQKTDGHLYEDPEPNEDSKYL